MGCSSSEDRTAEPATGGAAGTGGLAASESGTGGAATGGVGTGGVATGGVGTGGTATGGVGTGGVATGGVGTGGVATGGVGTGGVATGGVGTGGVATGGVGTGGVATGGVGTAGVGTGGIQAGGTGTGGASNPGGSTASPGGANAGGTAGEPATGGTDTGGSGIQLTAGACTLGAGIQTESGRTDVQYFGADVQRDGQNYKMITNGWGRNWLSHDISWLGSSLSIHDYQGSRQSDGAPAGYPSVFCGRYSDTSLDCGLPRPLADLTALNTAAGWSHPDGNGTYNVAYDVWLGDGNATFRGLQSYFMVWLRDPPGEQPAGSPNTPAVEVANAPGVWDIITGEVNGLPIVNYVRAEGDDTHEIAFDIMDFIRDARDRELNFPGNDLLAIAIGFEIWEGPVTNLSLDDFCLDIQ